MRAQVRNTLYFFGGSIMGNNRTPKCQCPSCNALGVVKFETRRRGGGNAFLCEYHARRLEGYTDENRTRRGTRKANGLTYSQELETSYTSLRARLELCVEDYLPTSDCTVNVEYKSPIFEGANALKAFLPSIEDLIRAGDMRIGGECGTHLHIGHHDYINSRYINYIGRFYHSLFVPLSEAMVANRAKAEAIFGRNFGGWNRPLSSNCDPFEHTNFINIQHDYSLEFRSCFFKSASQYSSCVDFCRAITEEVIKGFCKNVEKLRLAEGQRLTEQEKAKLTSCARKTGAKLAEIFNSWEA